MNEIENNEKETYPFRKIAYVSFIKGGLSLILGLFLIFMIKSDLKEKNYLLTAIKLSTGIGFLTIGVRSIWRGYKNEYDFSLNDVFDLTRNIRINSLLGQRASDDQNLAKHYANIFRSKNASLLESEKGGIKDWQFLFYKFVSKKKLSDIFEYVPFPITKFIANQSRPVSLIAFFLSVLAIFGFITYLEILNFSMIWINLFILIGLLTLWHPSKISSVTNKNKTSNNRNRIIFFILFYIITILLYQPYAKNINLGLLISIIALASIIIYTALVSFKLIEKAFSNRKQIDVQVSEIDLATNRVATQPNNIKQQFDNIISAKTGWYFKSLTQETGGVLAGDQIHKGDFSFEYVYETNPKIISTKYNREIEKSLSSIYIIGTILICIGIIVFFGGILNFPAFNMETFDQDTLSNLSEYSPNILLSLFLILIGTALYFFGSRLIYDIFMFFNSEIFFQSNLILFKAYGNYDEYEHISGGIKRKDTFTDFTPDIEVAKVTSSIFVHPYMDRKSMASNPRFIIKTEKNEQLLNSIISEFKRNLDPYLMSLKKWKMSDNQIEGNDGIIENQ